VPDLTEIALWDLIKHAATWIVNLRRASDKRKQESIVAVRQIITVSRETAVYIRKLNHTGNRDYNNESRLSIVWTELSFMLQDLGINKLAKRCQIKGKYWSNPEHYDQEFLERADVKLERMEGLARKILADINRS